MTKTPGEDDNEDDDDDMTATMMIIKQFRFRTREEVVTISNKNNVTTKQNYKVFILSQYNSSYNSHLELMKNQGQIYNEMMKQGECCPE